MATATFPNYHSSILIVGAGTWGCSTALHLARRDHKDITVLDAYDLPSSISAGNDINKIVEQGINSLQALSLETYIDQVPLIPTRMMTVPLCPNNSFTSRVKAGHPTPSSCPTTTTPARDRYWEGLE